MLMVTEAGGTIAPFDLVTMLQHGAPVLAGAPQACVQLQAIIAAAQ
jgi:hypothetical protein